MALIDAGFTLSTTGVASGTNYTEKIESGRFVNDGDNSYAERVFLVDWAQVGLFIKFLLGFPAFNGTSGGFYVLNRSAPQATLPDIHPRWALPFGPGSGYGTSAPTGGLYAQSATVEGEGFTWTSPTAANMQDFQGSIKFNVAKVKATYRALDYDVIPDAYISSEQNRFTTRTYTFNHQYATYFGQMYFVSGASQNPTVSPGKIVGILEKTMTWYQVPARVADPYNVPTYSTIKTLLGRTNSTTFDGDVAGTVLFLGVDPHRTKPNFVNGAVYWDIVYKFGVMNNGAKIPSDVTDAAAGWNYILNGYLPSPAFDLLTATKGSQAGSRIYQNGDLNTLFQVPV